MTPCVATNEVAITLTARMIGAGGGGRVSQCAVKGKNCVVVGVPLFRLWKCWVGIA